MNTYLVRERARARERTEAQRLLMASLQRFTGRPIRLGPRGDPLDYREWRERCRKIFGWELPFGHPLAREQLARLGFIEAAVKMEA